MSFTFDDRLGTYLRMWCDGTWVYVGASMRLQTMLVGYLVYLIVGWIVYRWRRKIALDKR